MATKQDIGSDIRGRGDSLGNLFKLYRELCSSDDPTLDNTRRYHFTRYLCVLTAGFLEVSVHSIYDYYVFTYPHLVTHLATRNKTSYQAYTDMRKPNNFNEDNLLRLTRDILAPWEPQLVTYLQSFTQTEDGTPILVKDSINQAVDRRNEIAHGKPSSGLTQADLKKHFEVIVQLATQLHSYLR